LLKLSLQTLLSCYWSRNWDLTFWGPARGEQSRIHSSALVAYNLPHHTLNFHLWAPPPAHTLQNMQISMVVIIRRGWKSVGISFSDFKIWEWWEKD
jgi:hypothetical protein